MEGQQLVHSIYLRDAVRLDLEDAVEHDSPHGLSSHDCVQCKLALETGGHSDQNRDPIDRGKM